MSINRVLIHYRLLYRGILRAMSGVAIYLKQDPFFQAESFQLHASAEILIFTTSRGTFIFQSFLTHPISVIQSCSHFVCLTLFHIIPVITVILFNLVTDFLIFMFIVSRKTLAKELPLKYQIFLIMIIKFEYTFACIIITVFRLFPIFFSSAGESFFEYYFFFFFFFFSVAISFACLPFPF